MILYAIPVSTYSAKVRIALGVKGVGYEMVPRPPVGIVPQPTWPSSQPVPSRR